MFSPIDSRRHRKRRAAVPRGRSTLISVSSSSADSDDTFRALSSSEDSEGDSDRVRSPSDDFEDGSDVHTTNTQRTTATNASRARHRPAAAQPAPTGGSPVKGEMESAAPAVVNTSIPVASTCAHKRVRITPPGCLRCFSYVDAEKDIYDVCVGGHFEPSAARKCQRCSSQGYRDCVPIDAAPLRAFLDQARRLRTAVLLADADVPLGMKGAWAPADAKRQELAEHIATRRSLLSQYYADKRKVTAAGDRPKARRISMCDVVDAIERCNAKSDVLIEIGRQLIFALVGEGALVAVDEFATQNRELS